MNIWFVSIFENTPLDDNQNTRYNSLVNEAVARKHQVTFWASTFQHNIKKQRFNSTQEVQINDLLSVRYVKSDNYSKNISLERLKSHFKLSKELINEFDKADEKPDLIVNAFPPVYVAFEISEWARKNNIPYVMDVIDPWPDVFKSHIKWLPNSITEILFIPLKRRVRKTVYNAKAVMGISNQYVSWAKGYSKKDKRSKCFYPAVQFDQMQEELNTAKDKFNGNEKNEEDSFEVIYAGSLGYSYDIRTILEAASILEKQYGNKIHFTIAGDGPKKKDVELYQSSHENLTYVGRVPKEELMYYYFKSDMGMTQHIKGATQSVTYKLFDLLACGLPILNSLESEMKSIILDNKVGFHNEPGDANKLVENIVYCFQNPEELNQMKADAIKLTKEFGDSKKVYSEALSFLESLKKDQDGVKKFKKQSLT